MDTRGLTASGKDDLYDHLPPYWPVEVREADSYYDFAFDPQLALQAAYRYAVGQGKLHAWPNFEAAWYGNKHVRGTFLLDVGAHAIQRDVAFTDLPGLPQIYEVALSGRARTNTHEHRASKLRSPRSTGTDRKRRRRASNPLQQEPALADGRESTCELHLSATDLR